jgi:hemoglobin/transferrin/lactoferrin receptor protein
MIKKIFFVLFLQGIAFGLSAQEITISPVNNANRKMTDTIGNLSEVTVTATRKNTELLSIPYAVSLVSDREIIAYQYRSTPEALNGTTGVFVQKTNHGGGSPFVRGLTGNQTLILVDGIRLNNSTFRYGPNQYFNTIDAATVSKIEVARGTGSVQYGSDALSGVVQVFTKEPVFSKDKTWHGSLRGKATTQDMEYGGRATVEYSSEKLALVAGYSNKKFGDLYGGDTTGRQSPSGYKEQAADFKLKYQLASNAVVTLSHQWLRQTDVPLYHRVKLENFAYYFFDPQQRQMTYAKLELTSKNKLLDKITFISSLQKSLERRDYQRNGNVNKFVEEDKVRTWGNVVDVFSAISKKWTANTGVEYYHDLVKSSKQQITIANNQTLNQRGLYPNNATSGNFSLYSLHHITAGKFDIEAGLRYNSLAITIPDTVTSALKLGDITVKPSSLVTNIALLFHIGSYQNIYSSFSTGYRTPNIDDLGSLGLVDFRYEIPAYDLKPEKTYNTEIGYRFINKKIQSSVSFFYMHLTDLITRVQLPGQQVGGYNVYTKQNSQKSYIRGTEISFNYSITNALSVKSNASYLYGQNMSGSEPMRRIPPFNGRVLLNYSKHNWGLGTEYLFAGKQSRLAKGDRDDNRIPLGGTPGWHLLNLYGNYTLHQLSFYVALQNIFNEDYRTHGSGINGMGRSASLTMEIKL